jgi:hypothetical protein
MATAKQFLKLWARDKKLIARMEGVISKPSRKRVGMDIGAHTEKENKTLSVPTVFPPNIEAK